MKKNTYLLFTFLIQLFFIASLEASSEAELDTSESRSISFHRNENLSPPEGSHDRILQMDDRITLVNRSGLLTLSILHPEKKTWETYSVEKRYPLGDIVEYEGSLFLPGPLNEDGLSEKIIRLSIQEDTLIEESFAKLKTPLFMPSLAIVDNHLYLLSGLNNIKSQIASAQFWRISFLEDKPEWEALADFPTTASLQSIVIGQFGQIAVAGGMRSNQEGTWTPHTNMWVYLPIPVDGTNVQGWVQQEDLPLSLAGAHGIQTGQAHMITVGGWQEAVQQDSIIQQSVESTNKDILISHLITFKHLHYEIPEEESILSIVGTDKHKYILTDKGKSLLSWSVNDSVRRLSTLDYFIIVLHFLLMAIIGFYFSKKQDNAEEFALGGRNVKWWAGAISMFATGASSISFMAIPALVYSSSLVWFTPVLLLIPLYFLQAHIIYPLLRGLQLTSTYEYLQLRFHFSLRYVASAQFVLSQILGRISIVMLLPALAISATTGLDITLSILFMGIITTIYTAIGGFEAVIWSDVIQGLLMLFALFFMAFLGIQAIGFSEFVEVNESFNKFEMALWDWDLTLPVIWIFIFNAIFQELAAGSEQTIIQRVFATPEKDVTKLAILFTAFAILISIGVCSTGLSMFSFFHTFPEKLNPTMNNDQVVPLYIIKNIPTGIAGLIIAALFAASMSTLSSSINSVATILSEDFYTKMSDKKKLIFMKIAAVLVGVLGTMIALYMASLNLKSIFSTFAQVMAFLGGGFASVYILGMFTKRANTGGVLSGIVISALALIYTKTQTDLHWTFTNFIAMGSALLGGYLSSFFFPGVKADITGLTFYTMHKKRPSK